MASMSRARLLVVLTGCALAGCAEVAPAEEAADGRGMDTGTGADLLAASGDLPMVGADLAGGPPDLASDLRGPPGYPYPRVNEVVPSFSGVSANEYVELIGADHDIDLTGWSLHQETSTGILRLLVNLGGLTLPRGGYVLITNDVGLFSVMADLTYVGGTAGKLAQAGGAIALFDAKGSQVDSLGWGTAKGAYVEGTAAADPGDFSCSRIPDGADTGDNHADAQKATPTPRTANHL